MILELDCGNSFIKWRLISKPDGKVLEGGVASSDEQLLAVLIGLQEKPRSARLVSVRSDEETRRLVAQLHKHFGIDVLCAASSRVLAGVSNGYREYERLGLDRWLALSGAFHLAGGACLILDLGTAVTSDFVAGSGEHLGGFICPGVPLMRNQLRTHTRRIRYDDEAAGRALQELLPGRSTVEAVERGCLLMLKGFVQTQLELARDYWGQDFDVFLTGGDASLVSNVLPGARVMPDLVFVGLALACPIP